MIAPGRPSDLEAPLLKVRPTAAFCVGLLFPYISEPSRGPLYVVTDITHLKGGHRYNTPLRCSFWKELRYPEEMHSLGPSHCCRESSSVLPSTPCQELYGHEPSPQPLCFVPSKPRGSAPLIHLVLQTLHHLRMFKLSSYFSVLLTPSFLSSIFLPSP